MLSSLSQSFCRYIVTMKLAGSLMLSGLALASAMPFAPAPSTGKWFDRELNLSQLRVWLLSRVPGFVVVVLENTNKATALADPYYRHLASMGMLLNGYQGEC